MVCIGNLTSGGVGKTPVVAMLAKYLTEKSYHPHILSRGYGKKIKQKIPVQVNENHQSWQVGDEPMLLTKYAPCWVCETRTLGAKSIVEMGGDIILLDDGFQSPYLKKDLSILIFDGEIGLGNGLLIPAGPLRESWTSAKPRTDIIMIIGKQKAPLPDFSNNIVITTDLLPINIERFYNKSIIAFAGIGRPQKFFQNLINTKNLVCYPFPDHHQYSEAELNKLWQEAIVLGAILVTTAKDAARLSPLWRSRIDVLEINLPEDTAKMLGDYIEKQLLL